MKCVRWCFLSRGLVFVYPEVVQTVGPDGGEGRQMFGDRHGAQLPSLRPSLRGIHNAGHTLVDFGLDVLIRWHAKYVVHADDPGR